jgi:hypothetical protein
MSASPASAAITADSSSSFVTNRSARTITWSHTLGSGSDRALVVAVSTNDLVAIKSDIATVRFNNILMHVAPNSHATSPGPRVLETQFFYLTGDELPAPGSYDVVVQFTRDIGMAAGGAVSMFGVLAGPPVAAATNAKPNSVGPITTISTLQPIPGLSMWSRPKRATLTREQVRLSEFSSAEADGIAGSAQAAATAGATTLSWDQPGPNRLVTSAVAFAARPIYRLTLTTTGSGSSPQQPAG